MSNKPDPLGVDPAVVSYQRVAEGTDALVARAMEMVAQAHPDAPKGAMAAGAMMAIVRFTIQHLIVAPVVPTVRGVLAVLLPALNKAAEAQLQRKPGRVS